MTPDPKSPPRIVDRDAYRRARARGPLECAACGAPPSNVHHVIQKGSPHFGDDVVQNFLLICGTGTTGCHGAWHGSPYTHIVRVPMENGWRSVNGPGWAECHERRDREWVASRIGKFIVRERPDTLLYVVEKLGFIAAAVFFWDEYRIPEETYLRAYKEAS